MKIVVITGSDGKVVGTARSEHRHSGGDTYAFKPIALAGQSVQELNLPTELEGVNDAAELHRALQKHLK